MRALRIPCAQQPPGAKPSFARSPHAPPRGYPQAPTATVSSAHANGVIFCVRKSRMSTNIAKPAKVAIIGASGTYGADGITWVLTRPVRPTKTLFVGAQVHKDGRGPIDCSIYDHGDFCLYCVASSDWDKLAPHVSSGPQLGDSGVLVPVHTPLPATP